MDVLFEVFLFMVKVLCLDGKWYKIEFSIENVCWGWVFKLIMDDVFVVRVRWELTDLYKFVNLMVCFGGGIYVNIFGMFIVINVFDIW